jgi:ABC-type multidrug transport system ATPase subunit
MASTEVLKLTSVGLAGHGPVLSLTLGIGQAVAIVGPAASGKSRLLRFMGGVEAAPAGQVHLAGQAGWANPVKDKKMSPQQLARQGSGQGQAGRATEALTAVRLWEERQQAVFELSPSQQAACELLGVFAHDDPLVCLDGNLDLLDPWALRSTLDFIRRRRAEGISFAIVTNRPDLVEECDLVVVVNAGMVKHAGRVSDLRSKAAHELEVVSERQPGVRAMVEPLKVEVRHQNGSMVLRAEDGQQLAAKLLLEGYGDVRYVVHRQPTLEECLIGLL